MRRWAWRRRRSGREDGRRVDEREQEIEKTMWKGRSWEESPSSGWMRG